MSATGNSQAERISRWESLISNLEPLLGEMPQFTDDLMTLKRMLGEARDLDHRQDDLRSQARDINDLLAVLLAQGDKLRRRIGAGLQGKFGFTSEKLGKFGFRPRHLPGRRRNPATPQPPIDPEAGTKEAAEDAGQEAPE